MGGTEFPTRAALQRRTTPPISPWAHGRGQNCTSTHGTKHQTCLLGREFSPGPPSPGVTRRGWRGQRAPGHPAHSRPRSPLLCPSCRRHLEMEMLPGFSRAACPAAGTPAQTLGQSQLAQSEEGPSRAGGVEARWSGDVLNIWQERSGENEPQSLPSPASSI